MQRLPVIIAVICAAVVIVRTTQARYKHAFHAPGVT